MNILILRPIISDEDKNTFISKIQKVFQRAYVGEFEKTILPTKDTEESFETKGSEAYIAEIDGERFGKHIHHITANEIFIFT